MAADDLPTLDVTSRGTTFVDNEGRTLTLRGVNLGGAKLPAGYRSDQSEEASGRSCCVQSSADDALLPSKPSSVVDFAEDSSPAAA